MASIFYERVGHEGRCPSPFSWRIRYALAHKGLDFEVRPVRFADVGTIRALSGQHRTPILSHGDYVVHETWHIACYLEEQFLIGLRCSAVRSDEAWPGTSTLGRIRN